MPNWVYNNLTIQGDTNDLDVFITKATAVRPEKLDEKTGKIVYTTEPEFSFWNFIAPPQEAVDSGEYFGTHGFSGGKETGNTPNNWYNFQTTKWGTKWDAGNPDVTRVSPDVVNITYETAWSIPEPVMTAMVEQHPELDFSFHCEEEQGWGAEYSGENGLLVETNSWSEPSCHSDYAERDNEDSCVCSWQEDEDDWFEDCPRPYGEFFVEVTQTYKLVARDAEQAWELATSTADGLELQKDETTCVVKDENGRRVYPLAENGVE